MKDYADLIRSIIAHKMMGASSRRFQVEHNEYHHNRIQPTDIEIIIDILKKTAISKFDFAAELYCRTLLAQIMHFKYFEYFEGVKYDELHNTNKYHFIETIGFCPSRCKRHIRPLVLPLLILYWNPNKDYNFYGSDNPSDEDARTTLKEYVENFEVYQKLFTERAFPLFEYIAKSDTPKSIKLEILNDFANYSITLDEGVLDVDIR